MQTNMEICHGSEITILQYLECRDAPPYWSRLPTFEQILNQLSSVECPIYWLLRCNARYAGGQHIGWQRFDRNGIVLKCVYCKTTYGSCNLAP